MVRETLEELRNGRMNDYGFEQLVRTVLLGLNAEEARVIPRNQDKGADNRDRGASNEIATNAEATSAVKPTWSM